MKNKNKVKSEKNLFNFKPLSSFVLLTVGIVAVLIGLSLLFYLVNYWFWFAIFFLTLLISVILYCYYVHPLKNIKSKGRNTVDVHLLSISIACFIYGVLCLPCIVFLFENEYGLFRIIPSIVSFSLFFIFSVIFILRMIYTKRTVVQSNSVYHLIDFANGNLPVNAKEAIICDEAIDGDLFSREDLINEIYNSLLKRNGNKKVVVGIIGQWGSGKTTYLNAALKRIKEEKDDSIIICNSFSAWKYTDERAFLIGIINEIYQSLDIGANDATVNAAIIRYVNVFLSYKHLDFSNIVPMSYNDKTIINIINEYLLANNRHLVFVIDNIDRLVKEEIRFVYKTIGDILNIKNITFVCLYDEEYVGKIINNVYPCNYLDKIIDIKIFIDKPSTNKIYNVVYSSIENFLKKYKTDFDLNHFSNRDKELLKEALIKITNIRAAILLLNRIFVKLSDADFSLNIIDCFVINLIKETDLPLYTFILENTDIFVTAHASYVADYRIYLDQKENNERKRQIIKEHFDYGKRFWKSKTLLEKLFPHSLSKYDSISKDEESYAAIYHRIYSGRFFDKYFKDADIDFLSAYSQIEKALLSSQDEETMAFNLTNLFNSYVASDHSELLKIIEERIDSIDKNRLLWMLQYFLNNFYAFDDTFVGFDLSTKNRVAILIDKLLISVGEEKAIPYIALLKNNFHKITLLASIKYWNEASVKYDQKGEELSERINSALVETANNVINTNINVFTKEYYRRGVLWRLRDNVDSNKLKSYVRNNVNPSNVCCFLCEFIGEGQTSNEEKPFVISVSRKNLELFFSLEELKGLISQASVDEDFESIIIGLIMKFYDDKKNNSIVEEAFSNGPINLWKYYEKSEILE